MAVEPMADGETLYYYAGRFTGALKNAFPGVNIDTRRDLFDVFIDGLAKIYLIRILDVKDEKRERSTRKPFNILINRLIFI